MVADEHWRAAFDRWGLGPILAGGRTVGGTINETTQVTVASGDFFLRRYRQPERAPGEHAIIAHARARSVAAVGPRPLPDGATFLDHEGGRYALFPRAAGYQPSRAAIGSAELAAMGRGLALLHRALRDYPQRDAPRRDVQLDRDATLARLAEIETIIGQRHGIDPLDAIARERLASRRAWLERQPALAEPDAGVFGEQVIHGDYQEANVFFAGGEVVAIIDWDNHYVASCAWEIARTLDFVCTFAPGPCRAFLAAYRATLPLADGELDRAVDAYGQMRAHDLWLYEEYFLAGNARVGQFIFPGGFVPIAARWAALRSALVD